MTVKGNIIRVTAKDIKNARLGATAIAELEEALLTCGYELSVETPNAK
jgi:hypothetical protein